jgi:hypothetical protein
VVAPSASRTKANDQQTSVICCRASAIGGVPMSGTTDDGTQKFSSIGWFSHAGAGSRCRGCSRLEDGCAGHRLQTRAPEAATMLRYLK